jgi:hypothetical protein
MNTTATDTAVRTLRPGLLVALNTSIRGNLSYATKELEGTHLDENGQEVKRWETIRMITDPAEHEAAGKTRGQIRSLITKHCAQTAFGLLCPEDKAEELQQAITEARALAEGFNDGARLTRVSVNVLYGRIAQDDVEATKAITAEMRTLMVDMQAGLQNLDPDLVQESYNKAKTLGAMLSDDAKARSEVAIEAAKQARRQMVKLQKAGETLSVEVRKAAIAKIDMARTSFLDLDDDREVQAVEETAPALDFDGSDTVLVGGSPEAADATLVRPPSTVDWGGEDDIEECFISYPDPDDPTTDITVNVGGNKEAVS